MHKHQQQIRADVLRGIYRLLSSPRVREHLLSSPSPNGITKGSHEHADLIDALRERFHEGVWLKNGPTETPAADPIVVGAVEYGMIDKALDHVTIDVIREDLYDAVDKGAVADGPESIEANAQRQIELFEQVRKVIRPVADASSYELLPIFPMKVRRANLTEGYWWIKREGERSQICRLFVIDGTWLAQFLGSNAKHVLEDLLIKHYKLLQPVQALSEDEER